MTLEELKNQVDHLFTHGWGGARPPKDIEVLITTAEMSIGARASVGIKSLTMGFDWEAGQARIATDVPVVKVPDKHVIPLSAKKETFGGVTFSACQACGFKIAKDDRYCRHCGQRLR